VPVGSSIADVERKLIMATLESCGGVRERTAEILGISLKTLYNRLREYGQSAEAASVSSSLPSSVSTVLPTATQPAS
jgi:DNA-binding NtrC family response regulator